MAGWDFALQRAMHLHTNREDKLETSIWRRRKRNSVFFVSQLTIYILRNNRTFAPTVYEKRKTWQGQLPPINPCGTLQNGGDFFPIITGPTCRPFGTFRSL